MDGDTTDGPDDNTYVRFHDACSFPDVLASFERLCASVGLPRETYVSRRSDNSATTGESSLDFYADLKERLWPIGGHRLQAIYELLDKRAKSASYNGGVSGRGKRVLVIGAGPCGLRAALETAMLGSDVVVIERRNDMTRNNVLHLWPFLLPDLRGLGAKKFFGRFCSGSIDHIGKAIAMMKTVIVIHYSHANDASAIIIVATHYQ